MDVERQRHDSRGYVRTRLLTGLQLTECVRVTADAYLHWLDIAINDEQLSVLGQASVVYDVLSSLRIAATVAGGTTPFAKGQIEGMLRIAYGYQVTLGRENGR